MLRRSVRPLVIAVVTALLIYWFLRNTDWVGVRRQIRDINPGWLALAFAANFGALLCRCERWRRVLSPTDPPPFYPTFFSTVIGFMSSAILPVRAGDLIRPALLSRRTSIRYSRALGTVLTERIFDSFAVLTLYLIFLFTSGRHFLADPKFAAKAVALNTAGVFAGFLLAGLTAFVLVILFFARGVGTLRRWTSRVVPGRFRESWGSFFDSFVSSLSILRRTGSLARPLVFTAGIWFLLCSQFLLVMLAMGRPLPITSSFFMIGITLLGLAIPTPGGVGGFHKACQIALTNFYGVDVSTSVAIALVFHVVGVAPVILTGTYLFFKEGFSLSQLSKLSEDARSRAATERED